MAVYALGIIPLMSTLKNTVHYQVNSSDVPENKQAKHVAYADDLTGAGKLDALRQWWDLLILHGPSIGYYVNESITWLIVHEKHMDLANEIFQDTDIKITTEGRRHLGATIGTKLFKTEFIKQKVEEWIREIKVLARIARVDPHSALCAFTHGLRGKYIYIMRTVPEIESLLQPLEDSIRKCLLPVLMEGHICNDPERLLLSLPPKYGGIGVINPVSLSEIEYNNSRKVTKAAASDVVNQAEIKVNEKDDETSKIKSQIRANKTALHEENFRHVKEKAVNESQLRTLETSTESGAYNWLTVLPIEKHGFALDKRSFWDAIHLRYSLPLTRLPENVHVVRSLPCNTH